MPPSPSPSPWPEQSPFPPIGEYGFLSDCESTALVAPSGNVEWMCLPRMDSPSVFGSILDRDAGGFRFGPADITVPGRTLLRGPTQLTTASAPLQLSCKLAASTTSPARTTRRGVARPGQGGAPQR